MSNSRKQAGDVRGNPAIQPLQTRALNVTHTRELSLAQVEKLRALLLARGWELQVRPYMHFFAQQGNTSVAVYEKGPKVVVQGKGGGEFIEFILEPEIVGLEEIIEQNQGDEKVAKKPRSEVVLPHFGIDESGKGDLFGPLVIAGAYVDEEIARHWAAAGIQDSKLIRSDERIRSLARMILGTTHSVSSVVVIGPERYNELYKKFGNLNRLLAWGHARVIENLLEQKPDCPGALSDQFANPSLIRNALMERGRLIKLEQRTKAESDLAVAAASILARAAFIDWLAKQESSLGKMLPRGASGGVKAFGIKLVAEHGGEVLGRVAKLHFKTATEILSASSCTQYLLEIRE